MSGLLASCFKANKGYDIPEISVIKREDGKQKGA